MDVLGLIISLVLIAIVVAVIVWSGKRGGQTR